MIVVIDFQKYSRARAPAAAAAAGQKPTQELMGYKETLASAGDDVEAALLREKVMFVKSLLQHDCYYLVN